jgi:poly(3-hydroxyalkanoate) synthetase
MEKRHPYAEATYRVICRSDRTFGVEVRIPDTEPTTVTSFATKADAEAWIAAHQKRVAASTFPNSRRWLKKRSKTSKAAAPSRSPSVTEDRNSP